ncbi:hypothetical protein KY289_017991 [Solanum tuberosum]|nr:hypothetical protein KY289_017991 [Solanum tuberosum]
MVLFLVKVVSADHEASLPFNETHVVQSVHQPGRCGLQTWGHQQCSEGSCCSISGWCGTTSSYCNSPFCQSQCQELDDDTSALSVVQSGQCGGQAGGKQCPNGECCSRWAGADL